MTGRAYDAAEAMRVKLPEPEIGGLFAPIPEPERGVPAWAESWGSLTDDQRKAQRERWKELLLPIVRELAARPQGVTASEVLAAAIDGNHLWGERVFLSKYPRVYAWVGPWMASLEELAPRTVRLPEGGVLQVTRESERDGSHGNRNGVYVRAGRAA